MADEKTCPYCAETIKAEAIKCRYCHSELRAEAKSRDEPDHDIAGARPFARSQGEPRGTNSAIQWFAVAAALFLLAGFSLMYGFVWSDADQSLPMYCFDSSNPLPCPDEMPRPFPTGSVIFAVLASLAGSAFLLVWIVANGVRSGGRNP